MSHEQYDIDLWEMAEAWRQQNGHEPPRDASPRPAESPAEVGVPAGHRAPDPSAVTAVPHAADVDHVQRLEADEPGDEQAAQSCALALPDSPEPDTLVDEASSEPVADPEPITPEPEAEPDPSREHRFALEVHKTRLLAAQIELEEIEARLSAPDCDDDESNLLLERRRKASDKLAWLRTRSEHLEFFAHQEAQLEMKVIANDAFEPLTKERFDLIHEYEAMANAIVELSSSSERRIRFFWRVRRVL